MTERDRIQRPQDDLTGMVGRESSSLAGILAALTALALFAVAAFWAIGTQTHDPAETATESGPSPANGARGP